MTYVDQFYAVLVYLWTELHNKAPIMGFLIAATVASLQGVINRNFKVAEVLLCGVLASVACTAGTLLSALVLTTTGLVIPPDVVGGFVAGTIGFAGSKATFAYLKHKFIKGEDNVKSIESKDVA